MASRLMEWTLVASFPAGIFLLLGVLELPSFVDPCHAWGEGRDVSSATACIGRTSTSETKAQAATRLVLFQGTTLLGLLLAFVGAARGLRVLLGAGAGLLAIISIPLMVGFDFVFPLTSAVLMALGIGLFRPPIRQADLDGPRRRGPQ